jgi:hypothetical protein
MMEQFKALMVDKNENDFSVQVKNITLNELPQGDNDFGDSRYYCSPLHSKVRR